MRWFLAMLVCGLVTSQSRAENNIPPQLIGKMVKIGYIETREQRVLDDMMSFTSWKSRIELRTFFGKDKSITSAYIAFVPTEDGQNQPQRNVQRNSEGGRKTSINGRQMQIIDAQNGGARHYAVQINADFKSCQVEIQYVKHGDHWLSSGIRDKKTFEMRNHQASDLFCTIN